MSEPYLDPAIVTKLIKAARDEPIGFAFGVASTAEANVLAVDRKKAGSQLFAALKKEGLAKGFWGAVVLDGSIAAFSCERDFSGAQKLLEEWLRRNKIALKVRLDDPQTAGGQEPPAAAKPQPEDANGEPKQEEDEEDADEAEEEEQGDGLFAAETLLRRFRLARKQPVFFAFAFGAEDKADLLALHPRREGRKLVALIRQANGATKGGFGTVTVEGKLAIFRCEKAPAAGLKKGICALFKEKTIPLKVAIYGPEGELREPGDEDDAAAAGLMAQLEGLLPALRELVAARPELTEELRAAHQRCRALIQSGDQGGAQAILQELERRAAADGADTSQEQDEASRAAMRAALVSWRFANEDVDKQIAALQAALRTIDDGELKEIAEFGLNGVTGNFKIPLTAALLDLQQTPPESLRKQADKALGIIAKFRQHIEADERIAACDNNPFDVPVTIRSTLGGVFDALEASLKAA